MEKRFCVLLYLTIICINCNSIHGHQYGHNFGISNTNGNPNLIGANNFRENYGANANSISFPGQTFNGGKYLPPSNPASEPIITKQFYLVSAEEDKEEQPKKHLVIGRPQKNYRVVFIKAPSQENVKLSAEYAPQEEKTVIYVLSKKPAELDVEDLTSPTATEPSKPEIFFIKYKTPDEAVAAQKEIQEQYDKLGGMSEFIDQGAVPVKSVIGRLNDIAANSGYEYKRNDLNEQSNIQNLFHRMRYYY